MAPPRQFLAEHPSGPRFEDIETRDLSKTTAVIGPAASVDGDLPVFVGSTGRELADSGYSIPELLRKLIARTADPSAPVENELWFFSDQATPANLSIRWRHGGTTYDFPVGTAIS